MLFLWPLVVALVLVEVVLVVGVEIDALPQGSVPHDWTVATKCW